MRRILVLAACASLMGCATMMQGTTQGVSVASTPSGARVSVNGRALGTTPLVADLKRKDTHIVRIEMDGYQPYEIPLTKSASGWVWGNLVFGGLPGLAIDAISGGLYKLSPESVNAELVGKTAFADAGNQLVIAVVLTPDPAWEKVGQMARE